MRRLLRQARRRHRDARGARGRASSRTCDSPTSPSSKASARVSMASAWFRRASRKWWCTTSGQLCRSARIIPATGHALGAECRRHARRGPGRRTGAVRRRTGGTPAQRGLAEGRRGAHQDLRRGAVFNRRRGALRRPCGAAGGDATASTIGPRNRGDGSPAAVRPSALGLGLPRTLPLVLAQTRQRPLGRHLGGTRVSAGTRRVVAQGLVPHARHHRGRRGCC